MISEYPAVKCNEEFQPYSWNGGSILAIAGEDYAIIASDNRMSEGYIIHSRNSPKIVCLANKVYMGLCGFNGDSTAFLKTVEANIKNYRLNHKREIDVSSVAQLVSNTLYYRRFFPYYTYIIVAGIDKNGKGAVYSYDPVGSYERTRCRAAGSGASIIQPILDTQISLKNQLVSTNFANDPTSVAKFVHDVFCCAAERDIYTGDGGVIYMMNSTQEHMEPFILRSD